MNQPGDTTARLRKEARAAAARAFVPYSGRREAAVLLLSDGAWVPGVRVESASFSLVIPALINAFSTAVACGRSDVVAVALSRPLHPEEAAYLRATPAGAFTASTPEVFVHAETGVLPPPRGLLSPFLTEPAPADPSDGIALARTVARRAYVPASRFPVGCVLVSEGLLVPGVNVEHEDWTRILCAERNALGTAATWGLATVETLYLTCLKDDAGTPCGACRQLLVELAPVSELWMDRGDAPADASTPTALLPGAFRGAGLLGLS